MGKMMFRHVVVLSSFCSLCPFMAKHLPRAHSLLLSRPVLWHSQKSPPSLAEPFMFPALI